MPEVRGLRFNQKDCMYHDRDREAALTIARLCCMEMKGLGSAGSASLGSASKTLSIRYEVQAGLMVFLPEGRAQAQSFKKLVKTHGSRF